jgi:O-antigen ligase
VSEAWPAIRLVERSRVIGPAALAVGLALAGAVAVTSDPAFVAVVLIAAVGLILARVSPAIPLGCIGVPTLVIALAGRDPFGAGSVRAGMCCWTLASVWFFVRRHGRLNLTAVRSAPVIASVLLALMLLLGTTWSTDPSYGWFKAEDFVAVNLVALAAALCIGQRRRDFAVFAGVTFVIAVAAAIVLLHGLNTGSLSPSVGGRFSIAADEYPIALGRDAAEGILFGLYFALHARRGTVRLAALAALPVLAVALFAAGSRGPVLGLAVGGAVFLALAVTTAAARRRIALVAVAVAASAITVSQLAPRNDLARALQVLLSGPGVSSNGRTGLWSVAIGAFERHPFAGIGSGSYATLNPIERYPHNFLLEVAVELGVLALILLLAAVVTAFAKVLRAWRSADLASDRLRAALVAALLAMAVVNASLSGDLTTNGAVWVGFGLACASAVWARRAQQASAVRRSPAGR